MGVHFSRPTNARTGEAENSRRRLDDGSSAYLFAGINGKARGIDPIFLYA
ncbi:MAG: hypothetical protein ACLSUQ_05755 [Monoglobus pectinilyticus]